VNGISGFGAAFLASVIACLAVVFAVGITGVVLLGVAVLLGVVAVMVVGSVIIAMLPLLFPALLLIGILMFFSRRKKNMEKTATASASV
jgi:lipopolysaccharide export LptBFGC system permease protein LptF